MNHKIFSYAALNAICATAYITLVSLFMNNIENILGAREPGMLGFVFMIMLVTFSVAMMGITIFGRATLWYLDGKKKEAIVLTGYTLLFFFILAAIALLIILI